MNQTARDINVLRSSWKRILLVARKEFSDIVSGKRLWLLIGLIVLMYILSMASLRLYPESLINVDMVFSSAIGSVSFIAPLLGIAFGYDEISRERESGTLRLLLSRPIYRDNVINGKILSSLTVVGIIIFASTFITASIAIIFYGVPVSLGDFAKLMLFSISSIVLAFSYYSISLFLSVFLKKSSHALLLSLLIWTIFTLIIPMISSLIAIFLVPPITIPGEASQEQLREYTRRYMEKFYEINSIISSPSINYHYENIVNQLFPRSTSDMPVDISRMFPAYYISILVLILYPAVFTILSYIMFVSSEEK